jgi:hypothetical protein
MSAAPRTVETVGLVDALEPLMAELTADDLRDLR